MNLLGLVFVFCLLPLQGTAAAPTESVTTSNSNTDASEKQIQASIDKQQIQELTLERKATRENFDIEKSLRTALQDPRINSTKSRLEQILMLLNSLWRSFTELFSNSELAATSLFIRWMFLSLALAAALLTLVYTLKHMRAGRPKKTSRPSPAEAQQNMQNSLAEALQLFHQGQHHPALRLATEAWIDLLRLGSEAEDPSKLTLLELSMQPFFLQLDDALRQPALDLFRLYTDCILADRNLQANQLKKSLAALQTINKEQIVSSIYKKDAQSVSNHSAPKNHDARGDN